VSMVRSDDADLKVGFSIVSIQRETSKFDLIMKPSLIVALGDKVRGLNTLSTLC